MHLIESKVANEVVPRSSPTVKPPPPPSSPPSSSPPPPVDCSGRKSRWDTDDTEDSGVDSVSSMVETSDGVQVEYADVIVGVGVGLAPPVQHQKSFLHTVYGCSRNNNNEEHGLSEPMKKSMTPTPVGPGVGTAPAPSTSRSPLRKNIEKIMAKYSHSGPSKATISNGSRRPCWPNVPHGRDAKAVDAASTTAPASTMTAVDSAKNFFLHSLLEMDDAVPEEDKEQKRDKESALTASNCHQLRDPLVPQLAQLLDAVEIQTTGPDSLLLISRDGTRASLRLTLSPAASAKSGGSGGVDSRRNSFNRLHRSSKRASQRRHQVKEASPSAGAAAAAVGVAVPTPSAVAASPQPLAATDATDAAPTTAKESSGAKRTRSVRRRPSQSKALAKKGFTMSMAIPPSKVATLASKFNSLISENKRSSSAPAVDKVGVAHKAPWHLRTSTSTSEISISTSSKPARDGPQRRVIDTIPELSTGNDSSSPTRVDSTPEPLEKMAETSVTAKTAETAPPQVPSPEQRRGNGSVYANVDANTPGPSTTTSPTTGVYGTVKSIVKQAIRKFEKLDVTAPTLSTANAGVSHSWHDISTADQPEPSNSEHPLEATRSVSLVEPRYGGIAPNTSFLWRDQRSIQNLIYEATLFEERRSAPASGVASVLAAASASAETGPGIESYYEIGGSSRYDTLSSHRGSTGHAYDTLQSNQSYDTMDNQSSSTSSHGYDLIGPPASASALGLATAAAPGGLTEASNRLIGISYDDVKHCSTTSVTYDELTFLRRPSNGYDELQAPSSDGYIDPGRHSANYEPPESVASADCSGESLRYEEFAGTSSTAAPVADSLPPEVATPASPTEPDSILYLYDDIHGYGGSNHSYEPIYARLNGVFNGTGPRAASAAITDPAASASSPSSGDASHSPLAADRLSDDSDQDGSIHEVCSYRLTQMGVGTGASSGTGAVAVPASPAPSLATSRTGTERRSETSDEWIDISDGDLEEPAWVVTRKRHEPTTCASFNRRAGHRQSRRRSSAAKIKVKNAGNGGVHTWTQTVRALVKNSFSRAAEASRQALDKQAKTLQSSGVHRRLFILNSGDHRTINNNNSSSSSKNSKNNVKSSARRLPSAETEASGTTGSSQTWEECGESDGDELADDHHYEALYEVIHPRRRPASQQQQPSPSTRSHRPTTTTSTSRGRDSLGDDSFDDSFDSDDAFEEVVVRGLPTDTTSDTSRDRPASRSGSERSKESQAGAGVDQPYVGISRFAEAASAQMRRLRRNWSTTKTDISRSINRIKKRSTGELNEVVKGSSPVKEADAGIGVSVNEPNGNGVGRKKSSAWALRQFRRRTTGTAPGLSSAGNNNIKKDSSTFYLTLTIEPNGAESSPQRPNSAPVSQASCPQSSAASPVPPLVSATDRIPSTATVTTATTATTVASGPVRPQRTSSASLGPYPTSRPKTAPPPPPSTTATAGAAKKPLTRLTSAFSEKHLAQAKSSLVDQCRVSETLYSDIAINVSFDGKAPASSCESADTVRRPTEESLTVCDTPYSRLSLASCVSRLSSEAYMGVNDLASRPAASACEDQRSYIDLQPPLETDELYISSHFADEPLYQFYTAAIIERAAHNQGEVSEGEDDYEVIGENRKNPNSNKNADNHVRDERQPTDVAALVEEPVDSTDVTPRKLNRLPTAMELVAPSSGRRTLWCELPEVIESGLLDTITPQQRKLQEAMFELITSEASYLRSLNVLTTHFIQSGEFAGDASDASTGCLSRIERHTLFSDIVPVRECSERLLTDLEKRWQENVLIREICDILLQHASKHFEVYIKYCTNQLYQERMLRELKENKPQFVEVLKRLEASPVCHSLAMHSFLMLPMQRITRLPLLVDAIFHRLDSGTPQYERCRQTMAVLNKIVQECNEGARKAERIHEMLVVSNQLDFADVKAISIMSASRWLVKKGELLRLSWRDIDARLTFGRKIHKQTVYVFLFTDLLVITKKKGEESYSVLDYCPRNMIQVEEYVRAEKVVGKAGSELGKNLILLTMLQNHENKTLEMILSCSSESDRTRWLEAVTPRTSDNPEEKIYEEWDCPQVQAIHSYVSTQPDELSLELADVVNVLRKMADGWYQGERLRDGERGWFPGNYAMEIASMHVRARNLRQRYRLLALSGNFIEEQVRRERVENKRKNKKLSVVSVSSSLTGE